LFLEIDEQIDDLGLNRNVQRRYRLIANQKPRGKRQPASYANPLALPAGEFVRDKLYESSEARR
jgi:hypothetical protein